ncbi:MAG: lipocalin-like domain-containing protein [Pseudomonadota bacterium]
MNLNPIGSWELESFEIDSPEKGKRPWGTNARGLLIYSATGHVSVAINKDIVSTGNPENDLIDSILFYAGTYLLEENCIRHQVTLASNSSRVGKQMVRFASLNGDLLTITTPQESYGKATIVWRKIS